MFSSSFNPEILAGQLPAGHHCPASTCWRAPIYLCSGTTLVQAYLKDPLGSPWPLSGVVAGTTSDHSNSCSYLGRGPSTN